MVAVGWDTSALKVLTTDAGTGIVCESCCCSTPACQYCTGCTPTTLNFEIISVDCCTANNWTCNTGELYDTFSLVRGNNNCKFWTGTTGNCESSVGNYWLEYDSGFGKVWHDEMWIQVEKVDATTIEVFIGFDAACNALASTVKPLNKDSFTVDSDCFNLNTTHTTTCAAGTMPWDSITFEITEVA